MKTVSIWAWRLFLVTLVIGGAVFWTRAGYWLTQQRRAATITGRILDAQTGSRVPNAKVVVSTWYYGISDSNPTNFGTMTDENGHFRIHVDPGYWIARIDIAASTPTNKYAFRQDVQGDEAALAANHLAYHQRELDCFQYQSFKGAWSGDVEWAPSPSRQPISTDSR